MPERYQFLNNRPARPGPVIYWMNRDQRAADNWALLEAQRQALLYHQPLVVVFCWQDQYLQATRRHYAFMLAGLRQVAAELAQLQIPFFLGQGDPALLLPVLIERLSAGLLITDFNPLRLSRHWRQAVAAAAPVSVIEVDAHNIIPVWQTSSKLEFAARTIRPRIHRQLAAWLEPFPDLQTHPFPLSDQQRSAICEWFLPLSTAVDHTPAWSPLPAMGLIAGQAFARQSPEQSRFTGLDQPGWPRPGADAARQRLTAFIDRQLADYPQRNDPNRPVTSGLSPWFHFGQLAPQRAALAVSAWAGQPERTSLEQQAAAEFLEELIVRRELADNFCYYNPQYDQFAGFPAWARQTLERHRADPRPAMYRPDRLEAGETADPLWNVAQQGLVRDGLMPGYLRMYWAKKLLEWSADPETALALAIQFNDTYLFDGRDPNGYTGIAWSIGGVHDRPWGERPVFGTIRYMSYQGCRRKFDVDALIRRHQQPSLLAQFSQNDFPV